jgi:hypothetical protein
MRQLDAPLFTADAICRSCDAFSEISPYFHDSANDTKSGFIEYFQPETQMCKPQMNIVLKNPEHLFSTRGDQGSDNRYFIRVFPRTGRKHANSHVC